MSKAKIAKKPEKQPLEVGTHYLSKFGWPLVLQNLEKNKEGKLKVYLPCTKTEIYLKENQILPYEEKRLNKEAVSAIKALRQTHSKKNGGKKYRKSNGTKAEKKKRIFHLPVWLFLDPTRGRGHFKERLGVIRTVNNWSLQKVAQEALTSLMKSTKPSQINQMISSRKITTMHEPNETGYLNSRKE